MSYLFSSGAPSYAEEQLSTHIATLSTLPINLTTNITTHPTPSRASEKLETAFHELTGKPDRTKLISVLKNLSTDVGVLGYSVSEDDKALEAEVMGRAVTMVWKEVLQAYIDAAVALEDERQWWESATSRRGVTTYLVQTLPLRLYSAIAPDTFSLRSFKFPSRSALFKPIPNASAALTAVTSPWILIRREMLSSRKALEDARDNAARRIGLLASQGPDWAEGQETEATRIYGVLCQALDVPIASPTPSKRNRPSIASAGATPASLLSILTNHLPQAQASYSRTLKVHKRPSALTRLWFPLLFLPPAVVYSVRIFSRNKQWMQDQILNARETVRGFFVQWVWEPLEGIGSTLRSGGEGLGVAPSTVKADQESLERMVLDLGRDYYHLSGPQLEALGEKVRSGDMEEVLRVYEKEMQNPIKNALLGSLVRTMLIQVQKTKTDVSLSLLSLDHLLRSQQLTFAFVGVAPSVLILYGLGGYLRNLWSGEKRGKTRRRKYFNGMRNIEKLLLTQHQEISEKDRGMMIVGVTGMRTWAAGLGSHRESFLDDLRLVENPSLSRTDKLRVVERIWRCWGTTGRMTA